MDGFVSSCSLLLFICFISTIRNRPLSLILASSLLILPTFLIYYLSILSRLFILSKPSMLFMLSKVFPLQPFIISSSHPFSFPFPLIFIYFPFFYFSIWPISWILTFFIISVRIMKKTIYQIDRFPFNFKFDSYQFGK